MPLGQTVGYDDIDQSAPNYVSVSGTPSRVLSSRLGQSFRNFFSIVPTDPGISVTVTLGAPGAAANVGTVLVQNQPFSQSMDANGKGCYQGEIWVTASAAGHVAVQETIEQGGIIGSGDAS